MKAGYHIPSFFFFQILSFHCTYTFILLKSDFVHVHFSSWQNIKIPA